MSHQRTVLAWTLALALMLSALWPSAAFAATVPTWSAVGGDHPLWYSFLVGDTDDENLSEVTIRAEGRPIHGASFEVYVGGDWNFWTTPDPEDWFGMSTETDFEDALWEGSLPAGGYFVRVDPAGAREVLVSISGTMVHGVEAIPVFNDEPGTFFLPRTATKSASAPVVTTRTVAAPAVTTAGDFDFRVNAVKTAAPAAIQTDETTLTPGVWMRNLDNQVSLIAFNVGNVEGQARNHVTISLSAYPVDGGAFQIFDGYGTAYWGEPEEGDWFGASSVHDDGTISWAGDLVPGTYFIRVEPQGVHSLLLAINGEAITY